ncbi:MAG: thioredoxin family protein [bacterium]
MCKLLQKTVEDAAKKLEIDYEIIKIEDMQEIAEYDVMAMPALVINDVLVLA